MFRVFSALAISVVVASSVNANATTLKSDMRKLVERAGNGEEAERIQVLKQIAESKDADAALKKDAIRLLEVAERWGDLAVWLKNLPDKMPTTDSCEAVLPSSPLYTIACFYEARSLTWVAVEGTDDPSLDKTALKRARRLLESVVKAYPKNRIARMYLGERFPSPKTYPAISDAPTWANLQREGLERLADIIEWWIDHRMRADKSYSGGWGDDCEMWRWWEPALIAFSDPKIESAQVSFSEALLSQPYLSKGYYSRKLTDVEHSAEDLSDAMTPLMHISAHDPRWKPKALKLVELMRDVWTGRNAKGQLQFKSTYFTADEVSPDPALACDTVYHPRAIRPALLYWQRTGDAAVGTLVLEWLRTWVAATKSTERGKPAGILPSAIHWPDGTVGGTGPDWWNPKNHTETALYEWPSAAEIMSETLLLGYAMSNDETFLEPLRSMAAIRSDYLKNDKKAADSKDHKPGSKDWSAENMEFLDAALAKLAVMTGTHEFDGYLKRDGDAYAVFRLFGNDKALIKKLRRNAEALSVNFEAYTSEVHFTDRVLRFPRLFRKGALMLEKVVEDYELPAPDVLYSMATGDPGSSGYFPMGAVRWLTPPREIAALVTDASNKTFGAELWHFGKAPRNMAMELLRLSPGNYVLDVDGKSQAIKLDLSSRRVDLKIPPSRLVKIRVKAVP